MDLKELSKHGEMEYCNCPPSGRGTKSIDIVLKDILPNIKSISLRKPFAMIVGSMATQGKSNNDIDIVVRGEDLSDKVKESINFRLYRFFTGWRTCKNPRYFYALSKCRCSRYKVYNARSKK